MDRQPVHPMAHRAFLLVAIVSALIAAAAAFPGRASADGTICGPNGYPYCTFAYTPFRAPLYLESGSSPYVTYGGRGNYDGLTPKVCITVRLLISDSAGGNNQVVGDHSYCHVFTGLGGLTTTSGDVYASVYRCCYALYWYHTWAHSWQVWADGHAHNDRYVASERVLR
jgi:hypothetical protein